MGGNNIMSLEKDMLEDHEERITSLEEDFATIINKLSSIQKKIQEIQVGSDK